MNFWHDREYSGEVLEETKDRGRITVSCTGIKIRSKLNLIELRHLTRAVILLVTISFLNEKSIFSSLQANDGFMEQLN